MSRARDPGPGQVVATLRSALPGPSTLQRAHTHIARVKGDLSLCIISDYAEAHELSQPDLELSRTELPRSGFAGIKPH